MTIIGLILAVLIPLTGFLYHRKIKNKALYEFVWKKSSTLKPRHILGIRPYHPYYYDRKEDKLIAKYLNQKENIIILGPPLIGKTRGAYEAIKGLNKPAAILKPRHTDINLENFFIPRRFSYWRDKVLLLDDLQRFVELQNFEILLNKALEKQVTILATCRSGMEYKKVKHKLLEKNIDPQTIFGDNVVELQRIKEEEGKKISRELEKDWAKVKFNGTVGSILMKLSEMQKRFSNCNDNEKTIMHTLRKLYLCGIYEEDLVFKLEHIRILAKQEELTGEKFRWSGWLQELKSRELILLKKDDRIQVEEIYIEDIFKPANEVSPLKLYEQVLTLFSDKPEALIKLGNKVYTEGLYILEIKSFMKSAAAAYEKALKLYTIDKFPMVYAMTQNNLGTAFRTLAEVENKKENCKKAITAYQEALTVYSLERFPMDYAMTQNNLGTAFSTLAEVENKRENCKKAITAYQEALTVYSLERFPIQYATTQNNLGNALKTLAEVENKIENCKKAITAYQEALTVYSLERFPMDYAMTRNNLGTALQTLAEVEKKRENCKKAITAYREALNVFNEEEFPEIFPRISANLKRVLEFLGK